MLLSIVDRQRYGLLEHAEALNFFYTKSTGFNSLLLKHKKLIGNVGSQFSIYALLRILLTGEVRVCVIWAMGSTYFFLPFLTLFFRDIKFFVVVHEPGGFFQRQKKGDPFIYSLTTSLYETFLFFSRITRITPNIKNVINGKLFFAPLIFSEKFQEDSLTSRNVVLYLGRRSISRSYDLFQGNMLTKFIEVLGKEESFQFFPTKKLFTTNDKNIVMKNTLCVLNLYKVNHNQSGVTPDALRYGVPVIVSDKDAYALLIKEYNAGIVIVSNNISHNSIIDSIHVIKKNSDLYFDGALDLYSKEFGYHAFVKYWLPLIS